MSISERKKEHVELTVGEGTQYQTLSGFENFRFNHNALPEVNLSEVCTKAYLLEREFSFPLFLSSMTGGILEAGPINAIIAEFCEEKNLPFGVGSQRALLEDLGSKESFSVVRKHAPNSFICSNIGGAQLIGGLPKVSIELIVDSIKANAVIVHLNPLQELMQPEGDVNFYGILDGIEKLVRNTELPVIVKETGAGISASVAKKLLNVGVKAIDVSGAGGTSWAKVENFRSNNLNPYHEFDEWGIPTADCLIELSKLEWERSFEIISSGGIRTAFDIAKSICLGAHFTAMAQPIISAINRNGLESLNEYYERIESQFKVIMTLLGVTEIQNLNSSHINRIS